MSTPSTRQKPPLSRELSPTSAAAAAAATTDRGPPIRKNSMNSVTTGTPSIIQSSVFDTLNNYGHVHVYACPNSGPTFEVPQQGQFLSPSQGVEIHHPAVTREPPLLTQPGLSPPTVTARVSGLHLEPVTTTIRVDTLAATSTVPAPSSTFGVALSTGANSTATTATGGIALTPVVHQEPATSLVSSPPLLLPTNSVTAAPFLVPAASSSQLTPSIFPLSLSPTFHLPGSALTTNPQVQQQLTATATVNSLPAGASSTAAPDELSSSSVTTTNAALPAAAAAVIVPATNTTTLAPVTNVAISSSFSTGDGFISMDVCEDNSHRWSTRPFSRATGTFDPFYQLQYQQEQRQRSLQHQQHTTNQILELQEQNRWANSNIDHLSRHMVLLMDKMKEMFPGGTGQDHSSALPSAFHETPNPTLATTTATVTTAPAMYSTSRKPFANFTEQMTGGSGRRIGEERGSAAAMALHTYSAESSLSPPVLHMVPSSNECSVSPPKIPSPSSSGTLSPPISAEILNIMFPLHSEEEEEEDNFSGTPARVQKQKKGWKNLQDRRHSRTLKRKSSAGSILSAGVGTGTAGMSNITAANIPCRPTISLRGPLTAGPSTAGPSTAGSSTVHPSTAGLSTAHPSVTGPSTAAPPTTVPPPPTTVPAPTVRFVMVPSTTNSFAATPSTTLAPAILRSTTALSTVVPSTTVSPTTRHYPASPFNSVINPSSTIASLSTTTGYSPLSGFYSTVPLTSNSTSGASQPTISVQTSHVAVPTSTAAGGVPTTTGLVPPTTPPVTVPSMSPSTSPTSESILEFTSFFDSDYDSDDDPTEVVNRPKPRQKRRRL